MKSALSKKHIDLEDLESQIMNFRALLVLLSDYFDYSLDYVKENPALLTCRYSIYGALTSSCIDLADNMTREIQDTLYS
jgi:hypothetical protein